MGQKINPIGLRLGINKTWDSRWFATTGEYGELLHEDVRIRAMLEKDLKQAAVSKIVIAMKAGTIERDVYVAMANATAMSRGPL